MRQWSVAVAIMLMGGVSRASIARAPADLNTPARSDHAGFTGRDSAAADWIADARPCDGDSPAGWDFEQPFNRLPSSSRNALTTTASTRKCDCRDVNSLTKDLENARELRDRFLSEEAKLRQEFPAPLSLVEVDSSQAEEKQFAEQQAPQGIESPPGYVGPDQVDYHPQDFGSDNLSKHTPQDQCRRSRGSQQQLDQAMQGSVCSGMADAIRAHEDYHLNACVQAGGQTSYFDKSGADRADEEAHAYEAQIEVLRKAIGNAASDLMKCGVVGHDRR